MTDRAFVWCIALFISIVGAVSCAQTETTTPPTPPPKTGVSQPTNVLLQPPVPVDVLTQHNDSQRTGANLQETLLNPQSVQSGQFGWLFDWKVDGQIYAQPLYVSRVPYKGRIIDMVVVATMRNNVYAFEAPSFDSEVPPSSAPLWCVGNDPQYRCIENDLLGAPVPYDYFMMELEFLGPNIKPWIGITATPVIDKKRGTIYLTAKAWDEHSHEASYELFALDLTDGHLKDRSGKIEAEYTAKNGVVSKFEAKYQLQRASLLESKDRIYLGFGTHMDSQPSHGWLLAYDAGNLHQPPKVYCTTCGTPSGSCKEYDGTSCMGGIWQAGGGPATDSEGNVYVMTGNGSYSRKGVGISDIGNRATSFIKLDKDLNVVGTWTPANYACLNYTDSDLGSAGPLFLSDESILIGGGKEGLLYALTPEAMQGTQIGKGSTNHHPHPRCGARKDPVQAGEGPGYWSIQAAPRWQSEAVMDLIGLVHPQILSQGFHHIHGSPVLWKVHDAQGDHLLLYLSAERDFLRAYEFHDGFVDAQPPGAAPVSKFDSVCPNSGEGMPGGFLTLSANGDSPMSGIIWASMPRWNQNALGHTVPGVLRAYRAYPTGAGKTLSELWNSDTGTKVENGSPAHCGDEQSSGMDAVGNFAKFVPPTVAEGKVYLATFSDRLKVYGLKHVELASSAAATGAGYNATLDLAPMPETLQTGQSVAISIQALNTGTAVWRASDGISLSSNTIPRGLQNPVEGADVLKVRSDVPPGQKYKFNFHLQVPDEEETFYYRWRLIREGGASKQPTGDWFGTPTSEWKFTTLRTDCNDLRKRAMVAGQKVQPSKAITDSLKAELESIAQEAQKRKCLPEAKETGPMEK